MCLQEVSHVFFPVLNGKSQFNFKKGMMETMFFPVINTCLRVELKKHLSNSQRCSSAFTFHFWYIVNFWYFSLVTDICLLGLLLPSFELPVNQLGLEVVAHSLKAVLENVTLENFCKFPNKFPHFSVAGYCSNINRVIYIWLYLYTCNSKHVYITRVTLKYMIFMHNP